MVGKNHEHCNDAQQFYAGITPTLFKIRVDGLALWEAVVSETIIVSPSFSLILLSLSNIPLIGDSIRPERPSCKVACDRQQDRRPQTTSEAKKRRRHIIDDFTLVSHRTESGKKSMTANTQDQLPSIT